MSCAAVVLIAFVLFVFIMMRQMKQGYPWNSVCAQWCRQEQPDDPTCYQRCLRTEAYAIPATFRC